MMDLYQFNISTNYLLTHLAAEWLTAQFLYAHSNGNGIERSNKKLSIDQVLQMH